MRRRQMDDMSGKSDITLGANIRVPLGKFNLEYSQLVRASLAPSAA